MDFRMYICSNWRQTHQYVHITPVPCVVLKNGDTCRTFGWGVVDNMWYCPECMKKVHETYNQQMRDKEKAADAHLFDI